jgi:hypothetical protein
MDISNLDAITGDSEVVRALKLQREEALAEQVDALGVKLAKLRDEAVTARKNSGIEEVWRKCEENYLGIDDENRHEFEGQSWAKPLTMDSPVSYGSTYSGEAPRSTVFVKLTSRYVDASAARLAENLLPVDDKPFAFSNTPVPEMDEAKADQTPAAMMPNGMPMPNPENPQAPLTVGDVVKKKLELAAKSAEKAETRVWDWLCESDFAGELRKCVHDAARIGVAVVKGPVPIVTKHGKAVQSEQGLVLTYIQAVQPGSRWVDPWDVYPDPACGEVIRNGSFVWEHDTMSAKQLQDLRGGDGYLDGQIKKVLKEGPGKRNLVASRPYSENESSSKFKFDVWHFTGLIEKRDLAMLDAVGVEDIDAEDDEMVSAILTMVNDSVIRAVLNPIESGDHGYDSMSWKRRAGSWAGVGVAEDLFTPQRMINGATRRMNDNAGLSAGVQIIVDRGAIYPEDGSWTITPNKIWCKAEDSPTTDVRQAFTTAVIPSMQVELMNIIQYALRLAEESAGLPLIAQGTAGISSPNTATAAEHQNTNANTLLRRVAKAFDDGILTPHMKRYYDWLMMDPSVPAEEKGDYKVVIQGSSALVERAIQDQFILQIAQMAMNPAFRFSPEKIAAEICKSRFISPERVQYTEEEWAQMQQQMQGQQQPPPQIAVAQIKAQADAEKTQAQIQADMQKAQLQAQTDLQEAQMERDRDTMYAQAEQQRNASEHQARMAELQLKLQLAQLDYANRNQMQLEDVKAKLAIESAKLNTTKELAAMNASAKQLPKPPVEPPGRAPAGQSFNR